MNDDKQGLYAIAKAIENVGWIIGFAIYGGMMFHACMTI